jgi:hypothetical protein
MADRMADMTADTTAMAGGPDPARLPGEPPDRVRFELLWRLAARLFRDHDRRSDDAVCAACRQPWPCSGRRLGELGLIRAAISRSPD